MIEQKPLPSLASLRPLLVTACLWLIGVSVASAAETRPPNVVFIMTDDQGSVDAGCYGAADLSTPSIDALAKRGVRLTQFYSAASVCSPSRAGLLTGRYPWRVGMLGNGAAPPSEKDDQLDTYTVKGITKDVPTLASVLHAAGYATGHVGKWHLGYGQGYKPLDRGFDYSFGFMGGCIDNYSHFDYWDGHNRQDLWENNRRVRLPGQYFPDLMVKKATAFIRDHREGPFFLYFALNMPHYPYQGDPKWLDNYTDKGVPYPRNLYAAFLSTMDERIGQLIRSLDEAGLTNNTIIVLQADNGHSTEDRAHGGGGSSGPYRGAKFSLFEGGIRLPAIVAWPGHLPEGETRGQIVHGCDWLPTLAELCGVPCDAADLDGRSVVRLLRSAEVPSPHDTLQWCFNNGWAVRQGPWKLMYDPLDPTTRKPVELVDGHWFLSNLEEDPGERTNQAAAHPGIVERLKAKAPESGPSGGTKE